MLTHLVITRFSINTVLAGKMRRVDDNNEYLQYRLRLFELFCLPSMLAQTNKNFKWFVLFGLNTPDWMRLRLDAWEQDGQFIPLYADCYQSAQAMIQVWLHINAKPGEQLLTTRLDNDDAVSCHLVEHLQAACPANVDLQYFCPEHGQQVVVKGNEPNSWQYYSFRYSANPFVSMVERLTDEPAKMIYHCKHGSIKPEVVQAPVVVLPQSPMWMQILHGKNVGNGLWTRTRDKHNLVEFPFLKEYYDFGIPTLLQA